LIVSTLKKQGDNYVSVFKWMVSSYYRREKKSFWLIQLLMGISVGLGLLWLLGVITGLNHLNDNQYLLNLELSFLIDFFALPLWLWLSVLSVAGLLGAGGVFLSYHIGVKSIIRYQVYLVHRLLKTINQTDQVDWLSVVEDEPRKKAQRIIKMGVQMTGLVVRRLIRMLIPLFTSLAAFVVLIKLDSGLLLNLIPLAILYLVALYFINRHAARNQVKLIGVSEKSNKQMGAVVDDMLYQNKSFGSEVEAEVEQSGYRLFSQLRYRRRLVEIHVVWVNTLFLVLGSALIVLDFATEASNQKIDWMHLILFLVALRYTANGLQQMASATVAFSRFLPETEMVYQLLHAQAKSHEEELKGVVFYFDSRNGVEPLLPQLLKLQFAAENCVQLDHQMFDDSLNKYKQGNCWVYSVRPVKFKQAVRRHQKNISNIICREGCQIKRYDVKTFLNEFNPQKIWLRTKSSYSDYDDEMD